MAVNFKNITIAFAVVAVLLAAAGGIYFVSSGGLERGHLYYHGNGGFDGENEVDCTYDHIVWGVNFDRSGYVLDKWTTNADGTGDSYKVGSYINYDKDVHIYAQWANVAEYNCVYVSSFIGHSIFFPEMTLHTGEETNVLAKNTYVLTKSPTAYITLQSEGIEWTYHAYNDIKMFMAEGMDEYGTYYCVMISTEYATDLSIDGDKMCMNISENASLNIVAVITYE